MSHLYLNQRRFSPQRFCLMQNSSSKLKMHQESLLSHHIQSTECLWATDTDDENETEAKNRLYQTPEQAAKQSVTHCRGSSEEPFIVSGLHRHRPCQRKELWGETAKDRKIKRETGEKNRAGARRVSGVAMCWRVNMRHADRSSHGHKTEKTSQTPSKHSHGHTVYYGKCTVILKLAWKSRSNPGMPAASDSHAWHCSPLHKVRLSTSRQSYYFTLLRGAEPFFSFRLKSACCNCKNVPM